MIPQFRGFIGTKHRNLIQVGVLYLEEGKRLCPSLDLYKEPKNKQLLNLYSGRRRKKKSLLFSISLTNLIAKLEQTYFVSLKCISLEAVVL